MERRRFEYRKGDSRTYWEVEIVGASLTIRYGRIGTQGQTRVTEHDSTDAALASAEKRIQKKVLAGYAQVESDSSTAQGNLSTTPTVDPDQRRPVNEETGFSPMLQAWLAVLRSFPKRKRPRRELTELIFDDTPAEAVAVLRALAGHKLRDTWLGWRMLFDLSLVRTAESTLKSWEIDASAEHSFNSATSVLLGGTKDGQAFFGAHWNDDGIVFFNINRSWKTSGLAPIDAYATAERFWTAIRRSETKLRKGTKKDEPDYLVRLFEHYDRLEKQSSAQAKRAARRALKRTRGKTPAKGNRKSPSPSAPSKPDRLPPLAESALTYAHDQPDFTPMLQAYLRVLRSQPVRKRPRKLLLERIKDDMPAELAALMDTMARHDLQTSSLCWRSLHTDLSISGTAEGILEAAEIDESAEGWFDERKSLMLGDSAGGEVYFGIHWDGGAPRFFEIDFEWQAYAVAPITTYRSAEALTIPHRREPNPAAGPEDRHFESIAGQFPGKGARVSRGLPCESLA